MLTTIFLLALSLPLSSLATTSPKRGLVYIPNPRYIQDSDIWVRPGSGLTWYYNYSPNPSQTFAHTNIQFVPQLWGAPSPSSPSFLSAVQSQLAGGANITHVMGFNEPDGDFSTGGSNIVPAQAASIWQRELEPLRASGIKLGLPGVTGSQRGLDWLKAFSTACNGSCTADFIPTHWYGNFEGMASHLGRVRAMYPNLTIWVTEFAYHHQTLPVTQSFFNTSIEYLDRLDYVSRYSYFGSFRSSLSNVGPNAAMLNQDGKLTDIGSWYLGGSATGVVPKSESRGHTITFANSVTLLAVVGMLLSIWDAL